MLLNSELQNTDDHLRNFSFINDDKGWWLSAVYYNTPDPTVGKYHQLFFNKKEILPRVDDAVNELYPHHSYSLNKK